MVECSWKYCKGAVQDRIEGGAAGWLQGEVGSPPPPCQWTECAESQCSPAYSSGHYLSLYSNLPIHITFLTHYFDPPNCLTIHHICHFCALTHFQTCTMYVKKWTRYNNSIFCVLVGILLYWDGKLGVIGIWDGVFVAKRWRIWYLAFSSQTCMRICI